MEKVTAISKGYKGEILHFVTMGGHNYVGSLDPSEHPLGPEWWRINNPCAMITETNKELKTVTTKLLPLSMGGDYRPRKDIRCEAVIEINTLDKNGAFHSAYMDALKGVESKRESGEKKIITLDEFGKWKK